MFKFLDPIRYYIYKQEVKKIQLIPQDKKFIQLDKARRVMLLFESNVTEQNAFIRRFIDRMAAKGIRVITFSYVDKKKALSASLKDYHIIDNSGCNIFGRPSQQLIDLAKDEQVDVVIDLCEEVCLPLRYLLLHSVSTMKVGKYVADDNVLDLMISPQEVEAAHDNEEQEVVYEQNESFLLEQIEKYLTMIGTKEP